MSGIRPQTTEGCRYCWMCRHACPVGHVTARETYTPHAWALLIESVARKQIAWNRESADVMFACADCGLCQAHCATDQPLPDALQRRATQGIRSQLDKFYVPGRTPTLREIATRKVKLDSLPFIGTPQRVADHMARTMEAIGGDGFAIRQGLWPGYVRPFVEQVVPLLQQRGVVRTAYTGRTLREHLQEF